MPHIQRIGGIAAIVNAILAIVSLVVVFGLIGPTALTDSTRLMQMAIENPAPLILQDLLKFVSAIIATILVAVLFKYLRDASPRIISWATLFGVFSILLLLINASLSLYATLHVADLAQEKGELGVRLNGIISLLGMAVIFANGLWYLLVSWVALKSNNLPRWLDYLGLVIGGMSLLPPLGIIVLLLSIPWSLGLGKTLLNHSAAQTRLNRQQELS